jgi:hypothetical protein
MASKKAVKKQRRREISSLTEGVSDGAEFSPRKPNTSQERRGKRKHRFASLEMTGWGGGRNDG